MTTNEESRLLALPLELLTRVTDCLNDESLPTLRLTCKALEASTFDRFTDTFAYTSCCIFYEERWRSLRRFLYGSDRLVQRLRSITFTTNPLEHFGCYDMALAPGPQYSDVREAQKRLYHPFFAEDVTFYQPVQVGRDPKPALVHSVLAAVAARAPRAMISLDLEDNRMFRYYSDGCAQLHEDILLAIATIGCQVDSLVITPHSTDDIEDLETYFGPKLLACCSALESFTFDGNNNLEFFHEDDFNLKRLELPRSILHNAKKLTILNVRLGAFRGFENLLLITEEMLFSNDLSQLTSLSLHLVVASEKQMLQVLTRSCPTLQRLSLGRISCLVSHKGWAAIFQQMSKMPKLETLHLHEIVSSWSNAAEWGPRLDFGHIKHGRKQTDTWKAEPENWDKKHLGIDFKDRGDLMAGLHEILAVPLSFARLML